MFTSLKIYKYGKPLSLGP